MLNHGGLAAGYASYTLFAPALDLAMVVLTNGTAGGLVHTALTRWLVGECRRPRLGGPANVPEGLTVFTLPEAHRRRLRTVNGLERVNGELRRGRLVSTAA